MPFEIAAMTYHTGCFSFLMGVSANITAQIKFYRYGGAPRGRIIFGLPRWTMSPASFTELLIIILSGGLGFTYLAWRFYGPGRTICP